MKKKKPKLTRRSARHKKDKLAINDMLGRDISQRIWFARQKRGMSQVELAAHSDIHPNAIGRFERALTRPSIPNLILLCRALGVTSDYLLGLRPWLLEKISMTAGTYTRTEP